MEYTNKISLFINNFLNKPLVPRYAFGTNAEALSLSDNVEITGFIDDIKDVKTIQDLPVIKSNEIEPNAMVVICAFMNPISISKKLENLNIQYIHYAAFLIYSSLPLKVSTYWVGFDKEYQLHKDFYNNLEYKFKDKESKEIYKNILNFRLTGDLKYNKTFFDNQKNQYFEDFLSLGGDEVFVDIGGYDGQTTLEFINRYKTYDQVHIFEPDTKNMSILKDNLSSYKNINFYSCGLSSSKHTLGIISSGSTSKVISVEDGHYTINLDKLDNLISSRVTFIKLDIEGAEEEAIEGARILISKYKPKLAISVYHKGDDLRVLYEKIININPSYNVYLRHYTEGIVETVMFFV